MSTGRRLSGNVDTELSLRRQSQLSAQGSELSLQQSTRTGRPSDDVDSMVSDSSVLRQNDRKQVEDQILHDQGEVKTLLKETERRISKRLKRKLLMEKIKMDKTVDKKINELRKCIFEVHTLDKNV